MSERKAILVTGSSHGIGAATVIAFAKDGYDVGINYNKTPEGAQSVAEECRRYGVDAQIYQCDVGRRDQCERMLNAFIQHFGRIDVLVNNAGVENGTRFVDLKPAQYERLINVNLVSYLHCSHIVLPYMIQAGGGCIVNTASVGGLMGVVNQVDYCAAKSGVIGLTRGLAAEYAPNHIRVNAVAPGMIWTDMLRECNQDEVEALKKSVPLGTIGEVEDIAQCVAYLVEAKYVTGQTIGPNGGLLMP